MSEGDLVEFFSSFGMFMKGYTKRNPGLVLSVKAPVDSRARGSAEVLWSDGSITSEHSSYLLVVNRQ